jgi:hypothetical protein
MTCPVDTFVGLSCADIDSNWTNRYLGVGLSVPAEEIIHPA